MYSFEKKSLDNILPLKFKVNYFLLKKLGLFGFALLSFIWGVGFIVILNCLDIIVLN